MHRYLWGAIFCLLVTMTGSLGFRKSSIEPGQVGPLIGVKECKKGPIAVVVATSQIGERLWDHALKLGKSQKEADQCSWVSYSVILCNLIWTFSFSCLSYDLSLVDIFLCVFCWI